MDLSIGQVRVGDLRVWDEVFPGTVYTPSDGLHELRKAIATWSEVPTEEIAITTGASLGLVSSLAVLERPGSILCPRPYYPAYPRIAHILGLRPIYYDLEKSRDWLPNPRRMAELVRDDTRALILNFPGNPTGSLPTPDVIGEIQERVTRNGILVLSDEVYASLIYDGSSLPDMRKAFGRTATVCIRSFSKTFGMPGERIGYVVAERNLLELISRNHHALTISPPATAQLLALRRLTAEPDSRIQTLRKILERNRDHAMETLSECRRIRVRQPKAGIFLWIEIPHCTLDSEDLAQACASVAGVKVTPGAWFGIERPVSLRASFALGQEELMHGFRALAGFLSEF